MHRQTDTVNKWQVLHSMYSHAAPFIGLPSRVLLFSMQGIPANVDETARFLAKPVHLRIGE